MKSKITMFGIASALELLCSKTQSVSDMNIRNIPLNRRCHSKFVFLSLSEGDFQPDLAAFCSDRMVIYLNSHVARRH
jgi:hypothetical protein